MPSERKRTLAGVFGVDAVNELAAIAIDILCDPPAERHYGRGPKSGRRIGTPTARVDWELILEGREIMERHGIHWRALKADNERPTRRS